MPPSRACGWQLVRRRYKVAARFSRAFSHDDQGEVLVHFLAVLILAQIYRK